MLYRAIKMKSELLEKIVSKEKKVGSEELIEVKKFLDQLNIVLPDVLSPSNYNLALAIYSKWELFLLNNNVYYKGVINKRNVNDNFKLDISQEHIELFNLFDKKLYVGGIKKSKGNIDSVNTLMSQFIPSNGIDDKFISTIDNDNLKLVMKGETFFKNSEFTRALAEYNKYLNKLTKKDAKDFTYIDQYFAAWVIHNIGNIYYEKMMYEVANSYYKYSLDFKLLLEKLYGEYSMCKLSVISSKMKYLSTILAFANIGVHYYLKELNIVKDELESGEKEFKNVNKKWYWGQLTFLHYLLAKANLYLSKDSEMKDNINQSLNYAQKSNDIASEVRARAYLYIYTNCPEKCKNEFNNSLEKLKKKNVISYPFVKKLINPINLHEFELESKKKTGNLHTVLRRIGV